MTIDDIQSDADARLIEWIGAEDTSCLWSDLSAWLRADPAHQCAFARAERAWRLAGPILRAGEPSAGEEEFEALLRALAEERRCSAERLVDGS